MFTQFKLKRKIYPEFLKQLEYVNVDKSCLVLWKNEDNFLNLFIIVNNNMLHFQKEKNGVLNIKDIDLTGDVQSLLNHYSSKETLDIIRDLKFHGIKQSSQTIIDFLSNYLLKSISYYKITREDSAKMFGFLLLKHNVFFHNNPIPTVIQNDKNKWID